MNAKDRANFINKVGTGTQGTASDEKICSQCGAVVKGKFCSKCGTPYAAPGQATENAEAAATSASETKGTAAMPAGGTAPAAKEMAEPAAKPAPKKGSPFASTDDNAAQDAAVSEAAAAADTFPGSKKLSQAAAPFASVKNTIQTGINKVGDAKYCLNCGATVKGKYCMKCGTPVDAPAAQRAPEAPGTAAGVVKKKKVQPYVAPPRRPAPTGGHKTGMLSAVQEMEEEQEESVFAKGLPEWSLEPPHTPVKRKTSKLL